MFKIRLDIFFFFMVTTNLHINYAGCPDGRPCLKLVATNLHIDLFIKTGLNSALS